MNKNIKEIEKFLKRSLKKKSKDNNEFNFVIHDEQ